MIAYVKGTLAYVNEQSIVVDVNGVGYLVYVSPSTIARLPGSGAAVQVFTYFQSGESGQALHGFLTREEVRLFTMLISVSGIGPKVASAILGAMPPQEIILSIVAEDAAALSKAPGVGKKTAQRVMLELKDKISGAAGAAGATGATGAAGSIGAESAADVAFVAPYTAGGLRQDAIDALIALGYGRTEAVRAVLEVADDESSAVEIIKLALKKLASGVLS